MGHVTLMPFWIHFAIRIIGTVLWRELSKSIVIQLQYSAVILHVDSRHECEHCLQVSDLFPANVPVHLCCLGCIIVPLSTTTGSPAGRRRDEVARIDTSVNCSAWKVVLNWTWKGFSVS